MPRLDDEDGLVQQSLTLSRFGYSAVPLDQLGSTRYTVVSIAVDISGSTDGFKRQMERAIKEVVAACNSHRNPFRDSLMIRLVKFDDKMTQVHGFKPADKCHPVDYDGILGDYGGSTALFATSLNCTEALVAEGRRLAGADFDVNGIDIVITDGQDTDGGATPAQIRKLREEGVRAGAQELPKLESLLSILIGVNVTNRSVGNTLQKFKDDGGFTQYEELDKADEATLLKLANFVSRSISSQSQALGTGGPSQALTF